MLYHAHPYIPTPIVNRKSYFISSSCLTKIKNQNFLTVNVKLTAKKWFDAQSAFPDGPNDKFFDEVGNY